MDLNGRNVFSTPLLLHVIKPKNMRFTAIPSPVVITYQTFGLNKQPKLKVQLGLLMVERV